MRDDPPPTLVLTEETAIIDKRRVETGRVRVRLRTESVEETAQAELEGEAVEVTRVPIGRLVDTAPPFRTEGDVTVISIVEEVLVVEKRLSLKEEIHIRRRTTRETVEAPVMLRRQHAEVERIDPATPRRSLSPAVPVPISTARTNQMTDLNELSPFNKSTIANERHGATLTALFDTRAAADAAADRLRAAGVQDASIRVTEGAASDTRSDAQAGEKGFFEALGDFFFPDDDRHTYAEGLSRGGFLLTVTGLSADLHERAVEILDDAEAVDLDERETEWRAAGWSGYQTGASGPAVVPDTGARATGTDETVQVVEERLEVGRRDVNLGRVRVRSYVREEPVSEAVELTEERVTIERRPVDRPVSATDDAFRDRTIELEEHAEEAVVSKEARVVEEINLRKDAETHTETVSDTVRKTEVEIEDERDALARADRVSADRVK